MILLIIVAAIAVLASVAYRRSKSSLEGALGVRFPTTAKFAIIDTYHDADVELYVIEGKRSGLLEIEKEVLSPSSASLVPAYDSFYIPKIVRNHSSFKEAVTAGHLIFAANTMGNTGPAVIGFISDRESNAWIVKMRMRSALSLMIDRAFSFGLGIMILIVVVRNVSFPKYLSPKLKGEKTPAQ